MPIYEYQCETCGQIEEVIQRFSDAPLTTCPHCSGKLHKLISHSSFHLKGSGWYVTDYANKSSANNKSKPKSAAEKTASGDKKKTPKESSPD